MPTAWQTTSAFPLSPATAFRRTRRASESWEHDRVVVGGLLGSERLGVVQSLVGLRDLLDPLRGLLVDVLGVDRALVEDGGVAARRRDGDVEARLVQRGQRLHALFAPVPLLADDQQC